MASQHPHDTNNLTYLEQITLQQRKRRHKTLSITGAVLAVLVIVGLAFSWFTMEQKLPHSATGHAGNTLDKPILSDTNSGGLQINWLDNTQFAVSDPYNLTYTNIYNIATHAQQQENIFDLSAQSFNNFHYTWNANSQYVVNDYVAPDTVPTNTSSPKSFTVTIEVWNVLTDKKLVTVSYDEKATSQLNEFSPPSALISPNNQFLAVGQNDGNATLWSLSTGKQVASYKINSSPVNYVQWASDSQHLLAQSSSGLVQLWNTTTGAKISSFLPPLTRQITYTSSGQTSKNVAASPILSPDGKRMVAVVGTNKVEVWDTNTTKVLYTKQVSNSLLSVSWLSDKGILINITSNLQVWHLGTNQIILNISDVSQQASWAFSPSQRYFTIINPSSQNVTIWDTSTGQQVTTLHSGADFQINGQSSSIVWSPDERYIATSGQDKIHQGLNNVIQIWNATTGKLVMQYHSHSNQVQQVTWSPDGKYLASVSDGNLGNVMEVWQAPH